MNNEINLKQKSLEINLKQKSLEIDLHQKNDFINLYQKELEIEVILNDPLYQSLIKEIRFPPYIESIFLADETGELNGVQYQEGELIVNFFEDYYPDKIDAYINEDGNLIISGVYADGYSISEDGILTFTAQS